MAKKKRGSLVFIAPLGLLAIWLILAGIPFWLYPNDPTSAGGYGDAFGLVNSVFAGFGFIGVALALYLKRKRGHSGL